MIIGRVVRGLLSSSILVSCAVPLLAQGAPPVRQSIDGNGVDLFQGTLTFAGPVLSLGGAEPQGLKYYKINSGGVWSDNLIAAINISGSVVTVTFAGMSDTFNAPGATYTSVGSTEGNGAQLSFNGSVYTYVGRDGTVASFSKSRSGYYPSYANEGRPTEIVRPDGQKLLFTYGSLTYCSANKPAGAGGDICLTRNTVYRVAAIRNSFGYQASVSYAPIDAVDPDDATTQPDLTTWSNPVGITLANLAAPSGSPTVSGDGYVDAMGHRMGVRVVSNKIVGLTRPGSTTEDQTIAYSSDGRVSSVTRPTGTTTYSASDTSGVRTVTVTDPLSHPTTYVFNIASRRMTSASDVLNRVTTMEYDASGRTTKITQPELNYTSYVYDARGNVTEQRSVKKTGTGTDDIVVTANYDATCTSAAKCNQPNWTKDARGNQTDYSYDATSGDLLTVTRPATVASVRPTTTYGYSALQAYFAPTVGGTIAASGEPVRMLTSASTCVTAASCTGTANESRVEIDYGPQSPGTGNNLLPVGQTAKAGNNSLVATSTRTYDAIGNVTAVDGPLSGAADTTSYRYDANRRVVGTISADPGRSGSTARRAIRTTYDAIGRTTLAEAGTVAGTSDSNWAAFAVAQSASATYDAADRPLSVTSQAAGTTYGVTQYSYDQHRLDCTAQRLNSAAWGTLPASACTLQAVGGAGADRITRMSYDDADRPTKVSAGYGTAALAETSGSYNNNGTLASLTDPKGNRTGYAYDGFDRLLRTNYPSKTVAGSSDANDYEQLGYDADSHVTSRRLRDTTSIGYTYDAPGRLITKAPPGEPAVIYGYDLLDRLTGASTSASSVTLGYDALGRQISEASNNGTINATMTMGYDLAGRRTSLGWPGGFTVAYDRLVTGETSAVRESGGISNPIVLATFAYDDLGRRTGITRGNGTTSSYTPDPVSRLGSLTHNLAGSADDVTTTFNYNAASQIASIVRSNDKYAFANHYNVNRPYTSNGLNQLTQAGSTPLGYDLRGNLTSSGTSTFGYSSENMLTSAPGGATLAYDPVLRLSQVTKSGTTTNLAYLGSNLVSEYSGTTQTQRYVFDPDGTDAPLVQYEGSGLTTRKWLVADERGSIVALTDGSGTVTATNRYDEYGVPAGTVASDGSIATTNVGRFQYTGQAWIGEVGLYNYKARMYSPTLGRFLQTDPIGYADGPNWYNYVQGDPVNGRDPSGTQTVDCTAPTICVYPPPPPPPPEEPRTRGLPNEFLGSAFCPSNARCYYGTPDFASLGNFTVRPVLLNDIGTGDSGAVQSIDEIVVTARRSRSLAGVRINFNLRYPLEQLWVITAYGQVIYVPSIAVMSTDSCGNTLGRTSPAGNVPSDVSALIHTHPDWASAWPGAGDYTSAQRYDVYNINRGGTWVLRQGATRGSAPFTLSGRAPSVPSSGGGATCR